jgi:putative flippase GtrA
VAASNTRINSVEEGLRGIMKWVRLRNSFRIASTGARYVVVGIVNFVISYLFFIIIWDSLSHRLNFATIALLSTTLGSSIGFFLQWRFTWGKRRFKSSGFFIFLIFQYFVSSFSIFVVPILALKLRVDIRLVQFCWSVLMTATVFVISKIFIYQNSSK